MGAFVQSGVRVGVAVVAAVFGLFVFAPPTLSSGSRDPLDAELVTRLRELERRDVGFRSHQENIDLMRSRRQDLRRRVVQRVT